MEIKLTPSQADYIEWALSPMEDFFGTEDMIEMVGREFGPEDFPKLMNNILTLPDPTHKEIMEDLLYRLDTQVRDMARSEPPEIERAATRVVNNLIAKLKGN